MTGERLGRVGVVGAGLIGASVGLALRRAGVEVLLTDRDPAEVSTAVAMGAGQPWAGQLVDHAVVAVPPGAVAPALLDVQTRRLATTLSHCASVQAAPLADLARVGADLTTVCGAHPVAGRAVRGAAAASPDLFVRAPWVLCPAPTTRPGAVADAEEVARRCGAHPVRMDPAEHDEVLARVSHVPQLVASLLAARLADLTPAEAALAGQGLRDTTRLADSDPALWGDIVAGNAGPVGEVLDALAADLDRLRAAVRGGTASSGHPVGTVAAVEELLRAGRAGRAHLPTRAGRVGVAWARLAVVIDDRPGQLVAVLTDLADASVNVADLAIEHASEHPVGVVEVAVAPSRQEAAAAALRRAGWTVQVR